MHVKERGGAARHRAGLEPQLFGGRERVFPHRGEAAKLLASEPEYDAWAWEIHHSAKKDAPSGTLLKAGRGDEEARAITRRIDVAPTAPARIPARTKSVSIRAADTITLAAYRAQPRRFRAAAR